MLGQGNRVETRSESSLTGPMTVPFRFVSGITCGKPHKFSQYTAIEQCYSSVSDSRVMHYLTWISTEFADGDWLKSANLAAKPHFVRSMPIFAASPQTLKFCSAAGHFFGPCKCPAQALHRKLDQVFTSTIRSCVS